MTDGFDVLIIGGGSAGCVVASRLSEDPSCKVALIEAGGWPADPDIADPLKWPALQHRAYDWDFRTTPQPFTANRVHDWARGRLMGGSSCLNAMAHVRGHPDDFVPWAKPAAASGRMTACSMAFGGPRISQEPKARSAGVADRCRSTSRMRR